MKAGLSCQVKSSVNSDGYGALFSNVCGYGSSCAGIKADAFNGTYGAYSMCSPADQLSFAFNQYYVSQNKASTACDFGGDAGTKSASSPSGSCSALINQAGTGGTGTVTSGANASAASSSKKASAAGAVSAPSLNLGALWLGAYVMVAGLFGMGMILF